MRLRPKLGLPPRRALALAGESARAPRGPLTAGTRSEAREQPEGLATCHFPVERRVFSRLRPTASETAPVGRRGEKDPRFFVLEPARICSSVVCPPVARWIATFSLPRPRSHASFPLSCRVGRLRSRLAHLARGASTSGPPVGVRVAQGRLPHRGATLCLRDGARRTLSSRDGRRRVMKPARCRRQVHRSKIRCLRN